MVILGIETSCDETAVALVQVVSDRLSVLSNVTNSQIALHQQYGGVVPEVAARAHGKNILPALQLALKQANKDLKDIDLICATQGPGLSPALMIGFETGKTLAWSLRKPFLPVNHMLGHVYSWLLPGYKVQPANTTALADIQYPFLALLVSGGHTEIVLVKSPTTYELLGRTLDDAVGEAFDKVARMLDLPYPGGPHIAQASRSGDAKAFALPRPMLERSGYDFSFSGLKTAVLYQLQNLGVVVGSGQCPAHIQKDMAASFQQAAVDTLVAKTLKALREYKPALVIVAGGVSANQLLREQMQIAFALKDTSTGPQPVLVFPALEYTGDNGAMIALAGWLLHEAGVECREYVSLGVKPNASLV